MFFILDNVYSLDAGVFINIELLSKTSCKSHLRTEYSIYTYC